MSHCTRRLQCVALLTLARHAGLGVDWLVAIVHGLFERIVDLRNFDRVMRAVDHPVSPPPSVLSDVDVTPHPTPPRARIGMVLFAEARTTARARARMRTRTLERTVFWVT